MSIGNGQGIFAESGTLLGDESPTARCLLPPLKPAARRSSVMPCHASPCILLYQPIRPPGAIICETPKRKLRSGHAGQLRSGFIRDNRSQHTYKRTIKLEQIITLAREHILLSSGEICWSNFSFELFHTL
ncbi:hypothetical protein LENED_002504 [Lentinula edodes]|nr:hypothetical protein LENED_002504 [Lentinula edodes]